jgi:hypothetical protein
VTETQDVPPLKAERQHVPSDPLAFYEWALEAGWSDGLPLVPPTEDLVGEMVRSSRQPPDHLVAELPPRQGLATVEAIAINAVMAGCRSDYLPLLIAAIEALVDPALNLDGIQSTTNPGGPMLIVNGPIRKRLDLACGPDALGPGHRANQTVGRAVRLILRNVGGGVPPVDQSVLGSPWKMGLVLGENEELSPWAPMHVRRGFSSDVDVVTVLNVESIINVPAPYRDAESVIWMLARAMRQGLNVHFSNGILVVALTPGHARMIAQTGVTIQQLKERLFDQARVPLTELPPAGNMPGGDWMVEHDHVLVTRDPDHIEVIVAGSDWNAHSLYFAGWGISGSTSRIIPASP